MVWLESCVALGKTSPMLQRFLFILAVCSSLVASAQNDRIDTVWVEPYKSVSYQAFFKTLNINSRPYSEYIQGFEFEWGNTYELVVQVTVLENPPMDGSSIEYKLLEVLEKNSVPQAYTFQLSLHHEVYLGPPMDGEETSPFKLIEPGLYSYFDDVEMVIPKEKMAEFEAFLKKKIDRKGIFHFDDGGRIVFENFK